MNPNIYEFCDNISKRMDLLYQYHTLNEKDMASITEALQIIEKFATTTTDSIIKLNKRIEKLEEWTVNEEKEAKRLVEIINGGESNGE